jgi:hypothetical protein
MAPAEDTPEITGSTSKLGATSIGPTLALTEINDVVELVAVSANMMCFVA